MRRVGIVVALEAEGHTLTARPLPRGECLALENGKLLIISDAGPAGASKAASRLLDAGADALVSWGCAAALDSALRPGDLVLPRRLHTADGESIALDAAWRDGLAAQLDGLSLTTSDGAIAESRDIVATADAKAALRVATGAAAVDMESAAVARIAAERNVPALVVRSIVDPAGVAVPPSVQSAFDAGGRLRLPALLIGLARRPWDIAGLILLGWHFRAAMQTLRTVGAHLCEPPTCPTNSIR